MILGFIEIGKIVGTRNKGELRVNPWCDSQSF